MDTQSPLRFEDAMERLETLVTRLEAGTDSLDDALAAYEEGVQIARACLHRLEAAEARIQHLQLEDDADDV